MESFGQLSHIWNLPATSGAIELSPIISPGIKENDGSRLEESSHGNGLEDHDGEFDVKTRGPHMPVWRMALVSVMAAGVQFGWALQLSLLTPYVETLGISHESASWIWLCGPISGLFVQPLIGVWSDTCTWSVGRRRPFIFFGALCIMAAVVLIGFAADIGYYLGDRYHMDQTFKANACFVFIVGFWVLDMSNNAVQSEFDADSDPKNLPPLRMCDQGPSRAILSDLAGAHQRESVNAWYSFWLAIGNILGYSAGAIGAWYRWFPWLMGPACGEACANLKAAFLLAICFLSLCTVVCLCLGVEQPYHHASPIDKQPLFDPIPNKDGGGGDTGRRPSETQTQTHFQIQSPHQHQSQRAHRRRNWSSALLNILRPMVDGVRRMDREMVVVMVVMACSWMAWFPFMLFDTDWMGREIYHGDPNSAEMDGSVSESALYQSGVREGALGLLLNAVLQALFSVVVTPLCSRFGAKNVWGAGNLLICVCMGLIYAVTRAATESMVVGDEVVTTHPEWVAVAAVGVFAVLGVPFAITMIVPFALAAQLADKSGLGQGLAVGILNLAIVVPQIVVSVGAGPWDQLFGGGNNPAFGLGATFALLGGMVAFLFLTDVEKGRGGENRGEEHSLNDVANARNV